MTDRPRSRLTFSLAQLFFALTLISLLCGLVANVREEVVFAAFLFSPAIILMIALCCCSKHPLLLILIAAIGCVFGFAVAPLGGFIFDKDALGLEGYLAITVPPAFGVLLTAGSFLLAEQFDRRAQHQ